MRKALMAAAVLALAGCETGPTAEQVFQQRMAYCQSLGFTPGTPEAGDCMLQLQAMDEQRRAALGAALIGSGRFNPPQRVQCYTVGGYTSCY